MGSKKSKNRKNRNKKNVVVTNKTKVVVMSDNKTKNSIKNDCSKENDGHKKDTNHTKCDNFVTKNSENVTVPENISLCLTGKDVESKDSGARKTIPRTEIGNGISCDSDIEKRKDETCKYKVKGPNSYKIKPMVERRRKQNVSDVKVTDIKKNKTKKKKKIKQVKKNKIKNSQKSNNKIKNTKNNISKKSKINNVYKLKKNSRINNNKNHKIKHEKNIASARIVKDAVAVNNKIKKIINDKNINSKAGKEKIIEFVNKYKNNQLAACIVLFCMSLAILGIVSQTNSVRTEEFEIIADKVPEIHRYKVFVNGIRIGTIEDKAIIERVCEDITDVLDDKYAADVCLVGEITYFEDKSDNAKITKYDELYSNLKQNLDCEVKAYSIYSGEKKVGSLLTEAEALELEDNVKKYFMDEYDPEDILSADVSNDVKIIQENVGLSEIKNLDELTQYAIIGTDEKLDYVVESGDNYWAIAYNHDMTLDELFSANPEVDENYLMPGDVLSLIVPVPLISVDITRELREKEAIPYDTEETKVSYLYTDQSRVKRAGTNGVAEIDYIVTERNGMLVSKEEQSRVILTEPTTKQVLVGTQSPPARIGTGTFINPLSGSYVSSRFGNRYIFGSYSYHTGIDLAKAYGSTISAADGGTVIFAGYKGSYGNMIEIDHGGGYTTRYAHCSLFYVSVGDKVYQGQSIAAVGLTGVTTGPHCHFEIRKYGVPVNPASYIY